MEMWLIIALVCAILASVASFFDNSLVDNYFNSKRPQIQKCFFGPLYAVIAIAIFVIYSIFFGVPSFSASSALLIMVSGIILSFSSIPYYLTLKYENTTGTAIFVQLAPVFYLIFGALFLGQHISIIQLIAFFVLLSAPLLIVFSTRKRGKKIERKAAFYIFIHLLICAFSYIFFLFAEGGTGESEKAMPMAMAIAFLLSGRAIFDIVLCIIFKKWRKDYSRVLKKSNYKALIPLFTSAALWISEDVLLRNAMMVGKVAVVSAVESVVQLLSTFLLGLVFTIIWPKFGRESLDRRTVVVHFIATLIAVCGIVMVENPELFGG